MGWCRSPGITATTVFFWQAVLYGFYDHSIPTVNLIVYMFLPMYNGLYYGKQAVANFTTHYIKDNIWDAAERQRKKAEKAGGVKKSEGQIPRVPSNFNIRTRTSTMTGMEVIDWKSIVKELGEVPQRGS